MAKKAKVYAVLKGLQTGIFYTWSECEAVVKGYPGAAYKGFQTEEEAQAYLAVGEDASMIAKDVLTGQNVRRKRDVTTGQKLTSELPEFPKTSDTLTAYVDGSYHDGLKAYAFGCVFLLPDGRTLTYSGNGREPDSLAMRNVAGEMLGAMYAVQFALRNRFSHLDICYDYAGIEKWATGEWKTNKDLTRKYAAFMQNQGHFIDIGYHKVEAHTNILYNELADQAAKRGLTDGNGIPEIDIIIPERL